MARARSPSRSYSSRPRGRSPPRGRKSFDDNHHRERHEDESYDPAGLLVRNLPLDARPTDLRDSLERFGPLTDIYLPRNYYTGIDGEPKDHCRHFLAGGEEGTPEAFFCHGCGCHLCFHWKYVEKEIDMSTAIVKYGKCLKNHTAHIGGRCSLDGCGEFVAAGEEGTQEAFCCAACGCHRSFHEKEYL